MSKKSIFIITCLVAIQSPLFSQKNESKPFYKNFNLEMNVGTGNYHYNIYPPQHDLAEFSNQATFNCGFHLNYRNFRFKLGVGYEFFIHKLTSPNEYTFYKTNSVNDFNINTALNVLSKKRRPNTFLGPYIACSFAEKYTNYFQIQLGADYYFKQFHVGYRHSTVNFPLNNVFPNRLDCLVVGYSFKIDRD